MPEEVAQPEPAATPETSGREPLVPRFASIGEAEAWAVANVADTIDLPNLKLSQIQSILDGIGDVLLPHNLRLAGLNYLRTKESRRAWAKYHQYIPQGKGRDHPGFISYRKSVITDVKTKAKQNHKAWEDQNQRNIAQYERGLADDRPEELKAILRDKIETSKPLTRWMVTETAPDPLRALSTHEAGHALYYQRGLKERWSQALLSNGVKRADSAVVSEYALTDTAELFAEVAAMLANGERARIPANILRAYTETLEGGS